MFCSNCGFDMPQVAAYCSRCGHRRVSTVQFMDIVPVKRAAPAQTAMDFFEALPSAALTAPGVFGLPSGELETAVPAGEPSLPQSKSSDATPAYLEALRTEGAIASFIVAGATSIIAALAIAGFDVLGVGPWSLVDAAVFFLLGFGIIKRNRVAGVAAFVLFLAETVTVFAVADLNGQTVGLISVIIRALLLRSFYRGMRGVVAPRRRRHFYGLTAAAIIVGFISGFVLSSVR